jgi:hypothetical protein
MSDGNKPSRPGEGALHNMKILQKESSVFKVPKVPTKRKNAKKATVLDEDVYVEVTKYKISKLILTSIV